MVKASELVREQQLRDKSKEKIFEKIFKRIEFKIKQASLLNLYECSYEIPEFLLNIPLYNLQDCKQYILDKLNKNEFRTSSGGYNIIYISWQLD